MLSNINREKIEIVGQPPSKYESGDIESLTCEDKVNISQKVRDCEVSHLQIFIYRRTVKSAIDLNSINF